MRLVFAHLETKQKPVNQLGPIDGFSKKDSVFIRSSERAEE